MSDIRVAVRQVRKNKGFALVAVATLAVGIGANTAIFSVIDNVLLRPLPYPESRQLVAVTNTMRQRPVGASIIEVEDLRQGSEAFSDLVATLEVPANLTGGDLPARIEALCVSPSYFAMFGVGPRLGRTFTATDETPGISPVTVISHALWQSRFGGRADVIGSRVRVDDDPYTVVGVMPESFVHPAPATGIAIDIWVPCGYKGMPFTDAAQRSARFLSMIGRLRTGVSVEQAQERVGLVAARRHADYPNDYPEADRWWVEVKPLAALVVGDAGRGLVFLFGAVGLVLLIACTNVAILLVARATGRRKELAVRAALGASRARLVRQLLTESVLLAVGGGVLGVALAAWATHLFVAVSPIALPRAAEVRIDLGVLGFTLGISMLTALLFGFLPALFASRTDLQAVLNEGGRQAESIAGRGLRSLLVIAEVALATVMLVNAGLLLRSLHSAQSVAPGFDPARVASVALWMPLPNDRGAGHYNKPENRAAFATDLLRRLRALPGVESAGASARLPMVPGRQSRPIFIDGRPEPAAAPMAVISTVSEGYLATLRVKLLSGRHFAEGDVAGKPRVAIVNRTLARRLAPGGDPIGLHLRVGREMGNPDDPNDYVVVGVVDDVRSEGLDVPVPGELYVPYAQRSAPQLEVVVRTVPGAASVAERVPEVVRAIDRNLPVSSPRSFDDLLAGAIARRRFVALMLALFAGVALTMAALGIYSVTSYTVAQRQREIGVRMAIGARGGDVLRMILGETLRVVGVAVAIGLAAAVATGRMVSGMLYGVSTLDPLTFGAIAALLAAIALVASFLPARSASRVDPMISMRRGT